MQSLELKIKAKSLAAEARIIRQERQKLSAWKTEVEIVYDQRGREAGRIAKANKRAKIGRQRWEKWAKDKHASLQQHLKAAVQPEARATHLARAFLKGTPANVVEHKCYSAPAWGKVLSMILRYGNEDSRLLTQRFEEWRQSAVQPNFN